MYDPLIPQQVKLLVAHINPDLDAIGACWLFVRFDERLFEKAGYYFVNAGDRVGSDVLAAKGINEDEVVHVDTGLGPFDHHQPDNTKRDSASLRVWEHLVDKYPDLENDEALEDLVAFINDTDHFGSFYWPEPLHDRYMFMLEEILSGLRSSRHLKDQELLELGMVCLDGVYASLKIKKSALEDIETYGKSFQSPWGKALAIENQNDESIKVAQKQGYIVVVRKDLERGNVRIKAAPDKGIDLTDIYNEIIARDPKGTWYLHPSKAMLLNGSRKISGQVPTDLSLEEIVLIVESANA